MNPKQNRRVLVVDDLPGIHEDFEKLLGACDHSANLDPLIQAGAALFGDVVRPLPTAEAFELSHARQGKEALALVENSIQLDQPYAVAFIDVRMPPGWDGVETVRRIWQVDPCVQVVLCTANGDRSWAEIAHVLGCSDQFLVLKKPFDNIEVRQLAVALSEKWRLTHELRKHVENLEEIVAERTIEVMTTRDLTVFALAKLAASRDKETGAHLERMRGYTRLLAEQLSEQGPYTALIDNWFIENLYRSTPLHDIGKVGIPDAILLKPDVLTPREFEIMKRHAAIGADALAEAVERSGCGDFMTMAMEIARYHHERYDGSGYPEGLIGDDIPLSARIVAVADVFDALTSERCYKHAFDPEVAYRLIEEQSGRHFDPAVVDAFKACFDDFLQLQAQLPEPCGEEVMEAAISHDVRR